MKNTKKYKKFFLPKNKNIITLCPGSRIAEIKIFMPIFINLINKINSIFKDQYIFHFPVPRNRLSVIKEYIPNKFKNIFFSR